MADTTVSTTDNGPYWVSGNFVVSDADGNEFPVQGEAYLCRCGQSEEKPFCDGSHNLAGLQRLLQGLDPWPIQHASTFGTTTL